METIQTATTATETPSRPNEPKFPQPDVFHDTTDQDIWRIRVCRNCQAAKQDCICDAPAISADDACPIIYRYSTKTTNERLLKYLTAKHEAHTAEREELFFPVSADVMRSRMTLWNTPAPEAPAEPAALPIFASPVEGALHMAELGLPITPLRKQTKIPFLIGWQEKASSDVSQITAWNAGFPGINFGCVAQARIGGFFILETDSEDVAVRYKQDTGKEITPTFTVQSRPGRLHLYFRHTAASIAVGNVAQNAVPCGDFSVRADREQCAAPGSIHPITGKPYEIFVNLPIAEPDPELLQWFIEQRRLGKGKPSTAAGAKADVSDKKPYVPLQPGEKIYENIDSRNVTVHDWAFIHWTQDEDVYHDPDKFAADVHAFDIEHCVPPLGDELDETVIPSVLKHSQNKDKCVPVTIGGKSLDELKSGPVAPTKEERAMELLKTSREEGEKILREINHEKADRETNELLTRLPVVGAVGATNTTDVAAVTTDETRKLAERANRLSIYALSSYDPDAPLMPRRYHYDGLIPAEYLCLWLGARKAEKSLFALWKAMCDACGRDWLNYKNLFGPVEVLYFDAEIHGDDIDERFREHIKAFSLEEQELIRKNLHIKKGYDIKRKGFSLDVENKELWEFVAAEFPNAQVVYLDCWYQLNDVKPGDGVAAKNVVDQFRYYFPRKILFVLHHTANESPESRAKKSPVWLRAIGPERWSSNISLHSVLTKLMELIVCQERYEPRGDDGEPTVSLIDLMIYSRSGAGSPLISFEQDYGDETRGEDFKYRRKMVLSLTQPAAALLQALSGSGRAQVKFSSKPAILKSAGKVKNSKGYRAVEELIIKGYILHKKTSTGDVYRLRDDGTAGATAEALSEAANSPASQKSATDFLKGILWAGGEPITNGVPRSSLETSVLRGNISWDAVRQAKLRLGILHETRADIVYWVAPQSKKGRGKKQAADEPAQSTLPMGTLIQ